MYRSNATQVTKAESGNHRSLGVLQQVRAPKNALLVCHRLGTNRTAVVAQAQQPVALRALAVTTHPAIEGVSAN